MVMGGWPLTTKKFDDALAVAFDQPSGASQSAGPPARFLFQQVTLVWLFVKHFAATAYLEPLLRPTVWFELGRFPLGHGDMSLSSPLLALQPHLAVWLVAWCSGVAQAP